MASTNASAGAGDSGDRREGCSGKNKPAENNQATTSTQVIGAEITGSDTATAAGVTVRGRAPVLALCRALLAASHDRNARLKAYFGDVIALTSARSAGALLSQLMRAPVAASFPCTTRASGKGLKTS